MRVVFLDQIVLEDQSFILITSYDEINGVNLLDKRSCLGIPIRKEI